MHLIRHICTSLYTAYSLVRSIFQDRLNMSRRRYVIHPGLQPRWNYDLQAGGHISFEFFVQHFTCKFQISKRLLKRSLEVENFKLEDNASREISVESLTKIFINELFNLLPEKRPIKLDLHQTFYTVGSLGKDSYLHIYITTYNLPTGNIEFSKTIVFQNACISRYYTIRFSTY